MKPKIKIEFENDEFKSTVQDVVAVLKIKCNAFESIANLSRTSDVLPWLNLVEDDPEIKAILVVYDQGCTGGTAYNKFLSNISGIEINEKEPVPISRFDKTEIRAIEINMIMNFALKISNFKKIFVSALTGEVVTPFFGLSLLSDFRLACPEMSFLLSHVKYGLHPSGALPFLLPKFIGQAKAAEVLLVGDKISAEEAKNMGLVTKILPKDRFEELCLEETINMCRVDPQVVKSTKTLLYNYRKELERYFELESNFIYK